jgi:hypothetical protein
MYIDRELEMLKVLEPAEDLAESLFAQLEARE